MSYKKATTTEGKQSAEDKALNIFADIMIEKIESITKDWQKPWFTDASLTWPKNLNGRCYNGMNALVLMMFCEKYGYKIPRFCTFDCVQRLNVPTKKGEQSLSRVTIRKGEKSFPVMLTTFTCVHKETKERIKYDDYKSLTDEERQKYNVYPKLQVFHVFNVAQTNIEEARPELYAKMKAECEPPQRDNIEDEFTFEPIDRMIKDQLWYCPIHPKHGDEAYFSISKDEIVIPEKAQFKDGESFYSNLFHEMAHSTGVESRLARIKQSAFGSAEYAREELVAELTAALTAQRYGMVKHVKEDSACYLKSWLNSLKAEPQFIKSTLFDVKKAASMISCQIDNVTLMNEVDKASAKAFAACTCG